MWQGIDHRRFPRGKYKCVVTVQQPASGAPIAVVTENIGLGGICVLLEKGMDIFSPVQLEVSLEDGPSPLRVGGTVVWVVRRRDIRKGSSFDTGIEFTDLPAEDRTRLEAILDKAAPA